MINGKIGNNLTLNRDAVWTLSDKKFGYSDGACSERYLEKVFRHAQDLTSNSEELEKWIIDWPSEYHLSRKRSQLLSGFRFDKESEVLEVGCGCGAITRFLGETFNNVIAVEGSAARAKLARLRTKELENVSIICAPFQEIEFNVQFDIIFCVGVFEYSSSFVSAEDPYNAVLETFKNLLKPDGLLVIAIENQFGLKYFASCREDHTNRMFEGIEGYPCYGDYVRTFGKNELYTMLSQYFQDISVYHPYPDYKLTSCVVSEKFFNSANLGELVGNYKSVDYSGKSKNYFSERLACLELDRNSMLSFFSNSFLFFAGDLGKVQNKEILGYLYTTDRCKRFQTITEFREDNDGSIYSHKNLLNPKYDENDGQIKLRPTLDKWQESLSLQGRILQRVSIKKIAAEELFQPCNTWIGRLKKESDKEGGKYYLGGEYLDCIWRNAYVHDNKCEFVDQEWLWHENISLNVLVIRAIYCFLADIDQVEIVSNCLKGLSKRRVITRIARYMDINLTKQDFRDFVDIEVEFNNIVTGAMKSSIKTKINLFLYFGFVYKISKSILRAIDSAIKLKYRLRCLVVNAIAK